MRNEDTRRLLETIRTCREELADSLERYLRRHTESRAEIEIVVARDQQATMRLGGRLLHSGVSPQREADRLVENLDNNSHDGVVLFGMGLGYHLAALRRRRPRICIVVIEPDPTVLRLTLRHHAPEWWCRYGPDIVAAPEDHDQTAEFLRRNGVSEPLFLPLHGVASYYHEEARTAEANLENFRRRRRVNRNTLRRFGKLWVRNTLRNLAGGIPRTGIEALEHALPDVPAVVCGAGPTLDEVLPFLPALRRRCLIVAVDTAAPVLQRAGVDPHIVVVSDPQYWNTRHMDQVRSGKRIDARDHPLLVAEPATHPRVFRLWRGPGLIAASLFPIGEFIDRRMGRRHKLGAGGSVATAAWDLARFMGATRVYLAGIDLGFPFSRTHCGGSFFEERMIRTAHRLQPAEQGLHRYLHDANPIPVTAAGGGTLLSDARMDVYRSWFSEQAIRHPEVTTSLLSPDSSRIENISLSTPDEVIRAHRPREIVLPLLRETTPQRTPFNRDESSNQLTGNVGATEKGIIEDLKRSIAEIEAVATQGLSLCETLGKESDPGGGALEALDAHDQALTACTHRELAGFLSREALEQATTITVETVGDAIEQAHRIYSALLESSRYHQELLRKYESPDITQVDRRELRYSG